MSADPAHLPDWLRGRWTVQRAINGTRGAFRGDATFSADGEGGATWRETGTLRLDGFHGPAQRTYLIAPDGPAWQVSFDDGRPFHPLDLSDGEWRAEHLCGADHYRGCFRVVGADALRIEWCVIGPGRDDRIDSDYVRAAGR